MARSKRTGREYESRREKGYRPDKRDYKPERYPDGFDRWGQPTTCGVIDPETGNECPELRWEHHARCEHHHELNEAMWSRLKGRKGKGGSS